MRLSECNIGRIVTYTDQDSGKKYIGHIVDLDTNCTNDVIPVVKWANPEKRWANPAPIHYNNITIYED